MKKYLLENRMSLTNHQVKVPHCKIINRGPFEINIPSSLTEGKRFSSFRIKAKKQRPLNGMNCGERGRLFHFY